jgi:hypothetical protein
MATYGTTATPHPDAPEVKRQNGLRFRHCQIDHNYYKARSAVDINNNRRQHDTPLEDVWKTQSWAHRVFTHLLATSEANANLAYNHFVLKPKNSQPLSQKEFRRLLARELIETSMHQMSAGGRSATPAAKRARLSEASGHELTTMKIFTRYDTKTGEFVPAVKKYTQRRCRDCHKDTRTYCSCTESRGLCKQCYGAHLAEALSR